MPERTLGTEGGWIVRSHIGWREERNILYKGVETSPKQTRFKTLGCYTTSLLRSLYTPSLTNFLY